MPHHVTQRGNYRQTVFANDDERRLYLDLLAENAVQHDLRLWAWCLMTNHVHLIAVPGHEKSLASTLQRVHCEYARRVHQSRARTGHLWQARFYSCALDEPHLDTALRYVEMNPVRARLVDGPGEYPWSSAWARLAGQRDPLVDCTCPTLAEHPDWLGFLLADDPLIERLRQASRTGRPAMCPDALQEIEDRLGRRVRPRGRGGRPHKAESCPATP